MTSFRTIYTELQDPDSGHFRSGHGVIALGNDIPLSELEDAVRSLHGDGWIRLLVEVQHLVYKPRVKWCGSYDWLCDSEGEWHGHWLEVQHNERAACCHTVVLPIWPWDEQS